jgi:hypothetical protein
MNQASLGVIGLGSERLLGFEEGDFRVLTGKTLDREMCFRATM